MARITVVGPGALGILIAARLAAAGHDVLLGCRTSKSAKAITKEGLHCTDLKGRTVQARVATATRPSGEVPALVIIATKCSEAIAAATKWGLGPMPVVGLQNGIMGDRMSGLLGDRYVDCTVAFPASRTAVNASVQTGSGGFHVGPWPRGWTPAAMTAARLLAPAGPVTESRNMQGIKWTKLLINSASSGLGMASGHSLGDLLAGRAARRAFADIILEGHRVGKRAGIGFEPVLGFRPGLLAGLRRTGPWLPDAIIRIIGRKYRRMRSSGLQDLERGVKTEVEELNGRIVQVGDQVGVETPINRLVLKTVGAIESGSMRPGPDALSAITSFHPASRNPSRRTRR